MLLQELLLKIELLLLMVELLLLLLVQLLLLLLTQLLLSDEDLALILIDRFRFFFLVLFRLEKTRE